MKPYGLTGNIGCGKSTVAALLASYPDVVVFDSDRIAKEIILSESYRSTIVTIVGGEVVTPLGIDVKRLTGIIFTDPQKKKQLEAFVHPLVWAAILEDVAKIPEKIAIVESAILYEVGWEKRFAGMIVAACSKEEQYRRLSTNRNMSDVDIRLRVSSQLPQDAKRDRAQFVIDTDCTMEQLEKKVAVLYQLLKRSKGI